MPSSPSSSLRPLPQTLPVQVSREQSVQKNIFPQSSMDVFTNINTQYRTDHGPKPQGPGMIAYGASLVVGHDNLRRLSHLLSRTGVAEFYEAQRDYCLLEACQQTAEKFQPKLCSINEAQTQDQKLVPNQICYEILPPQDGSDNYSIIYYIKSDSEKLPIPVLDKLYDLYRAICYGNSHDWEVIQVDVNKDTNEPVSLCYETANYNNDPKSFNTMSSKDLHLFCRVSKRGDSWERSIQQKNGKEQKTEVENPFVEQTHPQMAIVTWNGSFDILNQVQKNKNLKCYDFQHDPKLDFLDIDTYRKECIDLRADWLKPRKALRFVKHLTRPEKNDNQVNA